MQATSPLLRVLHLDDDPFELERVSQALQQNPLSCRYDVHSVGSPSEFDKIKRTGLEPDVVLLDIHLHGSGTNLSGIDVAKKAQVYWPEAVILMCSSADDAATIVKCLASGAHDFVSKKSDKGELALRVFNSYRLAKLKDGSPSVLEESATIKAPGRPKQVVIGQTLQQVAGRIPLITQSAIRAVFINGESGTGKEVVAEMFADATAGNQPFIRVNCGAITPTLLESELFGHAKGAFTGATQDKRGHFEAASGGWIFLDEVATLSPAAQVALLRVLENQEVIRVGSSTTRKIKVRIISATNEPIGKLVEQQLFRSDLWQRLREAEIILPPLRERISEIVPLAKHFAATMAGGPYHLSGPAEEILGSLSYQEGNVRELRNIMRAMTELHVNKMLTPLAFPARIWEEFVEPNLEEASNKSAATSEQKNVIQSTKDDQAIQCLLTVNWSADEIPTYDQLADQMLVNFLRALYERHGKMSLRGLSQLIGMSRSTLSGRLKALAHRELMELDELANIVGIGEKSLSLQEDS